MRYRSNVAWAALALFVLIPSVPALADVDSYTDDNGSPFEAYIETAHSQGLLDKCRQQPPDRICPGDPMTRGEMVMLIARGVGLSPPKAAPFLSRDGNLGPASVAALHAAEIKVECTTESICPDTPVTRGEMAALLATGFRWGPASDPSRYTDISRSRFAEALARLAELGGLLPCDSPADERLCPRAQVRRDEAIFAMVAVLDLDPAAIERAEPEVPPLGFGDSFDDLRLWDGRAPSYRNRVRLTSDGYRDAGLRVSIPRGSHFGADFKLRLRDATAGEPDRLYFRYYLKLDEKWRTAHAGKLPGFSGVYGSSGLGGSQSSPTNPGWSARLMFFPNNTDDPRVKLGYYVYHLGQEREYGDSVRWNEAGRLQPGEWYCLEGQVDMNTPGRADGSLKAWVDGTPALTFSGIEFRRPDEPQIKVESFWFNVYYGGKDVPSNDLGMTIDEVAVDTRRVGCSPGGAATKGAEGDFDGDGVDELMSWGECAEGLCLTTKPGVLDPATEPIRLRDTAWLNVESHQFGPLAGDVDGDGIDEFVYRGRCAGSVGCWRVHDDPMSGAGAANWGVDGQFSKATETLLLGDWDGDGLDDLAYRGLCGQGDDTHECWRVNPSTGSGFSAGADWGRPPEQAINATAADLDGDGTDDLLFSGPCREQQCWFAQLSNGAYFDPSVNLGRMTPSETYGTTIFDLDGDGADDIVSWGSGRKPRISVRFGSADGVSSPHVLARHDKRIVDLRLSRTGEGSRVKATLLVTCGPTTCVENLYSAYGSDLVDEATFRILHREHIRLPDFR